jgi:hypothetical protein
MPLTLPDLDDRRYADLVEEARSLLVTYAPSLTNHNPSDPLITLTELFAYFTEILLFRLNLITDANRVAFLKLLNGPDWVPPATHAELDAAVRTSVLAARTVDRAVTPADFEFLALASSPARIARAHCIPAQNLATTNEDERYAPRPGHVSVVIVLRDPQDDVKDVQDIAAAYIEPRRLLTTRLHVVARRLVTLGIHLTIHPLRDVLENDVRSRVIAALRTYLHPVTGGGDGSGWPFGRAVHLSDLYRLLDGVTGVDFVSPTPDLDPLTVAAALSDRLIRNDALQVTGVLLKPDELVSLEISDPDIQVQLPDSLV